jgi:hypothetical protein
MDLFDGDGAAYEGGLFEVEEDPRLVAPPPQRRDTRTAMEHRKVARRIGAGVHPLGHPIRLHPDAPRDLDSAEAKASDSTGPRCGGCRFRRKDRDYPKCWLPTTIGDRVTYPRISSSETSDVAAWWPACTSWESAGQT